MLFLARMDVTFPEGMDDQTRADFQVREKEYSGNLQRTGIMKGIWRVAGEYANYSIYDVETHDQLHEVISGFPMFPYLTVSLKPLAEHPNATKTDFFG